MTANDETDGARLARKLREVREYLNFSQQLVSERTGLPRSAISDIERGARRVESLELKRLANLYGYPTSYFLEEDAAPPELDPPLLALAREAGELTPEDRDELRRFIDYLHHARRRS